jgi:protein TonB
VNENGKLSDIKPLTKYGYGMEEEVVRLMKTSPDWIPAMQNGRNVTAYKKQTVTFVITEGK